MATGHNVTKTNKDPMYLLFDLFREVLREGEGSKEGEREPEKGWRRDLNPHGSVLQNHLVVPLTPHSPTYGHNTLVLYATCLDPLLRDHTQTDWDMVSTC